MGIITPEIPQLLAEYLQGFTPEQMREILSMLMFGVLTFNSQAKLNIDRKDDRKSRLSGHGPHNQWRITYSHVVTHDSSNPGYQNHEGGMTVTYPEHAIQHIVWYMMGMRDGLWRIGLSADYHAWAAAKILSNLYKKEHELINYAVQRGLILLPQYPYPPSLAQATARAQLEHDFPERYQRGKKAKPHYADPRDNGFDTIANIAAKLPYEKHQQIEKKQALSWSLIFRGITPSLE